MVEAAAFSDDGRFVVTRSEDGTVRVWNAADGESLEVIGGRTDAATFVRGSQLIAVAGHATVGLYACPVCTSLDGLLALRTPLETSVPSAAG
jgi:WD40 repeat protein